jgi:Kef-type K+ transport system membrane component KefB
MFAIGMELDIDEVRKKLKETILISHSSTIVPFFFGMLTAFFVYQNYSYKETPFISFSLFIGIAMSITAFPVLARIIQEKGMTKSHLGTIALASAANGDVTAWCLLAVVIAIAQAGSMLSAVYNILFSVIYLIFMFALVRPFLRMVGNVYRNKELIDKSIVAFMFMVLVTSSYLAEILGLHALFGAFIAGVIMPTNIKFRKIMTEKVEDVSLSLFLPLFFVSTGLRTQIGLINTPELWLMCVVFIIVAIVGKFGGAMIAARFVGESWKNSLYMGALMNTRGLMELVVLSIGYEMKILPPQIFVILVLMTLVTTFMTTPLMSLIKLCFHTHHKMVENHRRKDRENSFKVLISFGRASNGQTMLNVADQLFSKGDNKLDITALHLTVGSDVNPLHTDNFEAISFGPILYGANKLGIKLHTRYEVSSNAGQDICEIVNTEGFDFLMVGAGISYSNLPADIAANNYRNSAFFKKIGASDSWFSPSSLLKDKTRYFIEHCKCDVGVLINRDFSKATKILVIISGEEDLFLLKYAETLRKSTHGKITIRKADGAAEIPDSVLSEPFGDIDIIKQKVETDTLSAYDFMMVSYHTWNRISVDRKETLQSMPSTLILGKYVSE